MKFLICFVVFASITMIGVHADDGDAEMLKDLAQDCKKKENASDADMDTMMNNKLPETAEGKCMIACLQKQFGVMDDNNNFNPEGVMELARMKSQDKDQLAKMEEACRACANVQHGDRCEKAYLVAKCLAEKLKEYGVMMS